MLINWRNNALAYRKMKLENNSLLGKYSSYQLRSCFSAVVKKCIRPIYRMTMLLKCDR